MMSTLLASVEEAGCQSATSGSAICRQACYLPSQGQPLFAWLHHVGPMTPGGHGILICPPVGHEQIHSHRALRHLADSLAVAGFVACRFDYHGMGDSAGIDEDPDRVATWQRNICDAIGWLKERLGCRQISVIGLRLGALLALKAVAGQAVSDLVLWAPVINGRQYLRELQALSLSGAIQSPDAQESGDLEAAGFVVTQQTAADLCELQATHSQPGCQRVLIVARDDFSEDRRLSDHLSQLGIVTQQIRQPGYAAMMAEPHRTEVPVQAIDSIVNWLAPADGNPQHAGRKRQEILQTDTALPQQQIRERVLSIDGQPALFGILAEPASERMTDLPLIVLLNAGATYRVGPNRLNVLLARQLAARGFHSLRVDLAGLGDSVAGDCDRENDPYRATMFRDIDLVLKHAQRHLGCQRAILIGLCSGAYAAFQSAAQFANPALVECVLINPLTFFWKEGMSIQSPEALELKSLAYYTQAANRPMKWWRLVSGRSQIGISGALALLPRIFRGLRRTAPVKHVERRQPRHDGEVGHPTHDDLSGDLQQAIAAGRHLAFFFSSDDPGHSILKMRAWRVANALRRAGKLTCAVFENADHTFSRRRPRQSIIQAIAKHLSARYTRLD